MPCWTTAFLWSRQPDHQLEDDEAERDHGQGPTRLTHEQIARVAEGHHRRRSQAQAPTQSLRLLNVSHTAPGSTRSSPPFSQVVDRRTHEFSSASGHSTCCWDFFPVYRDTNSQVVKSGNSFTFNLQEKFWAFVDISATPPALFEMGPKTSMVDPLVRVPGVPKAPSTTQYQWPRTASGFQRFRAQECMNLKCSIL